MATPQELYDETKTRLDLNIAKAQMLEREIQEKVAEKNHLTEMFKGSNFDVPSTITLSETIFSQMNIFVSVLLLIIIPTFFFYLGKKNLGSNINVPTQSTTEEKIEYIKEFPIQGLDYPCNQYKEDLTFSFE